jgi:hypothetical protein
MNGSCSTELIQAVDQMKFAYTSSVEEGMRIELNIRFVRAKHKPRTTVSTVLSSVHYVAVPRTQIYHVSFVPASQLQTGVEISTLGTGSRVCLKGSAFP